MSTLPKTSTGNALAQRIASLREKPCENMMAALHQEQPDPKILTHGLASLLRLPVVRMQELSAWAPRFDVFPFSDAVRRGCALLQAPAGRQYLVVTDPFDTDLFAWALSRFGSFMLVLASQPTFEAWVAHAESSMTALGSIGPGVANGVVLSNTVAESLNLQDIGLEQSPAVRFVNSTLYDALKAIPTAWA
jgi:general secretion pathway protein E